MKQKSLYLDVNATTRPHPQVIDKLPAWAAHWGNPSSVHGWGRDAKKVLRQAHRSIGKRFGVAPVECIFTSGGSESNTLAIFGSLRALRRKKSQRKTVILGGIEHPSVAKVAPVLESMGYEVITIPVSKSGIYDLKFFENALGENVALVSVMWANNEIGTLAPISEMLIKAHGAGALFHSDCVQTLGKVPISLQSVPVDYASFSAHKFGGLKGAGILFVRKSSPLDPITLGGGQERGRRAGTENLIAIAAMAEAVEQLPPWAFDQSSDLSLISKSKDGLPLSSHEGRSEVSSAGSSAVTAWGQKRDQMEQWILDEISGIEILGRQAPRLPNTSCLIVDGVDGEALMIHMDLRGYGVSTGAACSSGNPEPSPVLLNIGIERSRAQNSLRLSLPIEVSLPQLRDFVSSLGEVVTHLRQLISSMEPSPERGDHDHL